MALAQNAVNNTEQARERALCAPVAALAALKPVSMLERISSMFRCQPRAERGRAS